MQIIKNQKKNYQTQSRHRRGMRMLYFDSRLFAAKPHQNPWDMTPDGDARTNEYFNHRDINKHFDVLKLSAIGKQLVSFSEENQIKCVFLDNMPENTEARYSSVMGSKKPGIIQHGTRVHAALLGHELRHAWQDLVCNPKIQPPQSPEEQIIYDRFIEADASAIEFMITIQCVAGMGVSNVYSENLIGCLDSYQKQICLYSSEELLRLANEPLALSQATRQAFDQWIVRTPIASGYDLMTEQKIALSKTGELKRFFARGGMAISEQSFDDIYPRYTRRGVDPQFVEKLVDVLGDIGMQGRDSNYLRDSEGLPFMDEFYTRICNYRLEKLAESISPS